MLQQIKFWKTYLAKSLSIVAALGALFLFAAGFGVPAKATVTFSNSYTFVEKKPNPQLKADLVQIFGAAASLEVKHITLDQVDRSPFSTDNLDEQWRYFARLRCAAGCGGRMQTLVDLLAKGRLIRERCGGPITTGIYFFGATQNLLKTIYISGVGACFEFDHKSYFVVSDKFQSLLPNGALESIME